MINDFLEEVKSAIDKIDRSEIEKMIEILREVRNSGRLFLVGSGGGAGHASHACCDFRKLCGIEAYAPYDNVTELTARTNDEGWSESITGYLKGSYLDGTDCLFVFSVGGGAGGVSPNLTEAISFAKRVGAKVIGIVGKEDCPLKDNADAAVVIYSQHTTPVTEGLQAVIWHLIVTELQLKSRKTVW